MSEATVLAAVAVGLVLGADFIQGDNPMRTRVFPPRRALRVSPREPFRTVAVRFRSGALGAVLRGHAGDAIEETVLR